GIGGVVGHGGVTAHAPIEPHVPVASGRSARDLRHGSPDDLRRGSRTAGVFPHGPGGRARWAAGAPGAYCLGMNDSLPGHGDRPLLWTWFWVSLALLVTGLGALPALGGGLLLLVPWLLLMQLVVRIERRRAVATHGLRVILPAHRRSRRHGTAGWLQDRWFELGTGAFWRGVLHHHLAILVTGLFFLAFVALLWCGWKGAELALVHGPVELASRELSRTALAVLASVCVLLSAVMLALGALADRGLARGLISGSEDDLREQVAELAERRQGAVDAAAQERLRIERDLHDGVQPRLVTLAMTLGVARGAIQSDPARAERLVGEAHAEAKAVMTDLRQLARGIHPAVLIDRGLDPALSALAARSPIPVALDVDLSADEGPALDREREAVAYFVVAEALTNIAKHAAAT